MIEESLRLFKSIVINDDSKGNSINKNISEKTLKYGFIFSNEIIEKYPGDLEELIPLIKSMYGKDVLELNQTFHKSLSTVRDSDIRDLIIQQLVHYITLLHTDLNH